MTPTRSSPDSVPPRGLQFDDSRLEDPEALAHVDEHLRELAATGARVRIETAQADLSSLDDLGSRFRPRAVIASGPEARLIRAVLEPFCPVPFVAWPAPTLPAWVGSLDLVLVLTTSLADPHVLAIVTEAARRGSRLLVACPTDSQIVDLVGGASTTVLPTMTGDSLAAAVVMLAGLHKIGLGPAVQPDRVAETMDSVAERCSPFQSIAKNPAKDLAIGLGDALPLVWGGSVLASRASRRIAESLRRASGRPALAADAKDLLPVIAGTPQRDVFADPFVDATVIDAITLVTLDDASTDPMVLAEQQQLLELCEAHDVRVLPLRYDEGSDVERYASLLLHGRFGAAYLRVGLNG